MGEMAGQNIAPARTWPVRVKRPGERGSVSRSAARALDVLEYFGAARCSLRAIEIARALDLHASTANQLLKTMVESGHLVFDARTKTYLPSHRLACFGAWIVESYGDDERLRGLVQEVQSASGEIVTLTTPNDIFMQIVDLAGSSPTGQSTPRGLRVSVFGSAVGGAYISVLPDADIVRLADRARLPAGEVAEVLASADLIRRDGVAECPSPDGLVWSLAIALPSQAFRIPLVLGLAAGVERIEAGARRTELRTLMRDAVDRWLPAGPS
jgi:DNA-binding IclR family transcriptional regulator